MKFILIFITTLLIATLVTFGYIIIPPLYDTVDDEIKTKIRIDLKVFQSAIKKYSDSEGSLPEKLDQLSPKYIKSKVSKDFFWGYIYTRIDESTYRLECCSKFPQNVDKRKFATSITITVISGQSDI